MTSAAGLCGLAGPGMMRVHSGGFADLSYEEYSSHDGLGLAELVKKGELTPRELLNVAISRIEAADPKLNCISKKMYDFAGGVIQRGIPQGPFEGVPFLLKDLSFDIRGVESAQGSRLFKGWTAKQTSTVVERYQKAGLVILGKSSVPELGILGTTESTYGGVTRNPYDLERTVGGSSGGSACAVAAGMVPVASASDGGGSIRIPASCCGLFGLKPTRARVPMGPQGFEGWGGLAVKHVVSRSVRDSAALLDASAGAASGDAYLQPGGRPGFLRNLQVLPGKLKIALVRTMPPTVALDPECLLAFEKTARQCEALGHRVEECTEKFSQQFSFGELRRAHGVTVLVSIRKKVLQRLEELGRGLREDDLEPVTRYYHEYAQNYSGVDLQKARDAFFQSSRQMAKFQQDYDVILTPTLALPPIEHGKMTGNGTAEELLEWILRFIPCTAMANWTGQPAMTLPLHRNQQGLPIGSQFMGRLGDEKTLLQLAHQLEMAHPWSPVCRSV